MSATVAPKMLSRMRAGGVVVSRGRLVEALRNQRSTRLVAHKKLRIAGRPYRKAERLTRR